MVDIVVDAGRELLFQCWISMYVKVYHKNVDQNTYIPPYLQELSWKIATSVALDNCWKFFLPPVCVL